MSNKNILLITNTIYGYEKYLMEALSKRGYFVQHVPEGIKMPRKEISPFWRAIRGLAVYCKVKPLLSILAIKERQYYSKIIGKFNTSFQTILSFGGKQANATFLQLLKNQGANKILMFLWDDLQYMTSSPLSLSLSDKVYSFSSFDVKNHGFIFRPSFYAPNFQFNKESKDIDIYYKANPKEKERIDIIKAIDEATPELKKDISFYVKKNTPTNLKLFGEKANFDKYSNDQFSNLDEIADKSKHAKALLDITYKNQVGLGLRPIEAIGANCKLITTNEDIVNYPFYDVNNIFILKKDLSNLGGLKDFLKLPYMPLSDEMKYRYSVDGFLDDLGL